MIKLGTRIGNGQLAKVSLIITVLIVLPRLIGFLEAFNGTQGYFFGSTLSALLLRGLFFFSFSFIALQLNTNLRFDLPFRQKWKTFMVTIALSTVLALISAYLFLQVYFLFSERNNPDNNDTRYIWVVFLVLAAIVYVISDFINLQRFRQESNVENERLQRENLKTELAALRSQVNPHFLFNSLNSLLNLVKENKGASQYVRKLSFLYRYILQSGERDLVPLKEELRFLESYIHLIKARYREKFDCLIDLDESLFNVLVPPMALQLLVENAVKHNEISEDHPLTVKISANENMIAVQNQIKPRTNFAESSHMGLANLNTRYKLLLQREIKITNENQEFNVELPIVK